MDDYFMGFGRFIGWRSTYFSSENDIAKKKGVSGYFSFKIIFLSNEHSVNKLYCVLDDDTGVYLSAR